MSSTSNNADVPDNDVSFEEPGFESARTVSPHPVADPVSPEESARAFRLPKGYRLEVVASEPMISEPAAIAWDGNGRMYVCQLETYMQTIDAKGQDEPVSRIMLLEDTDNDGRMDKSSVFLDKLLSPRMILCVGDELLVNETNTFDIFAYKDEDGDGRADSKRPVYQTPERAYGNVEHQRTGLDWNLDNWIYVTTDPVRFRYKNKRLVVDSLIYGNNGQWGLTHDDAGRLFYSRAASGTAAAGYHINPVYGQLEYGVHSEDSIFRRVWPGVKTPDANARLRKDSTLETFTAVCGQSVFRGDRLPASMKGNYFVAEPVGRVVRRARISEGDGEISLRNVYHEDEFITTNDMNFRPVNTYTGPDGCLYIVDMYRGIIQEATWVQPGMPIYSQILSRNLDKNIKNGRIYRLVHETTVRGPQPKMLDEPAARLVTYLDHPNGWWRDNAQKELIVRGDQSVIPALIELVSGKKGLLPNEPSALARLHALWTLDGLDAVNKKILFMALRDKDKQVRKAGVRISEQFLNDDEIAEQVKRLGEDPDTEVKAQVALSLLSVSPKAEADIQLVVQQILDANIQKPLIKHISELIVKNEETRTYGAQLVALNPESRKLVMNGAKIFQSLCSTCHGPEGKGLPGDVAPPLIGKFRLISNKEGVIKILLHGLTGPVDGKTYPDPMVPMGQQDDEWIASVLNYVRYDLGMRSFPNMPQDYLDWVIIKPEDVKKVREKYPQRTTPWTWKEILSKKE